MNGKLAKWSFIVTVVGVLIAAAALLNEMLAKPPNITQSTTGDASPAIANSGGKVTVTGTSH